MMDVVAALSELELLPQPQIARVLLLLRAFTAAEDSEVPSGIEGLAKIAVLDFLLRYPNILERALIAKHASVKLLEVQTYERGGVDANLAQFRFAPWDNTVRRTLLELVGMRLVQLQSTGHGITVSLTDSGSTLASELASMETYGSMAQRASAIKSKLNISVGSLIKFMYATFPELVALRRQVQ